MNLNQLTGRELAVLQGIVDGHTYEMIAAEMDISPRTVETYCKGIREKIGRPSMCACVAVAVVHRLVVVNE